MDNKKPLNNFFYVEKFHEKTKNILSEIKIESCKFFR